MQRGKLGAKLDVGDNLIVDEHRLAELLATMHDAVANGTDLIETVDTRVRVLGEHVEHHLDGDEMVLHRLFENALVVLVPMLHEGIGIPDLLAQAACHELFGFGIDDLVLEG